MWSQVTNLAKERALCCTKSTEETWIISDATLKTDISVDMTKYSAIDYSDIPLSQ